MSLQLRSPGTISLPASFSSWKITRNRSMYVSSSLRTRHLGNAGDSHGPGLSQSKHDMKSGAHSKYRAWPTSQNLRWEWCSLQSIAEGAPSGWRLLAQLSKKNSCSELFLCSLPLLYWLRQIVAWIRIRGPESRLVKSMTHSIPETQPGWPIGNRKEVHDVNQLVVHLHLNKSYETLWAKWRLQDFQLLCVANKAVQATIFGSIKSAKLNWNQEPFSL